MIIDLEEAKNEIERGHEFREVDKEIENIKKELIELGVDIEWRNDNLSSYKTELEKLELERNNMSFFKKIFISKEAKDKYLKEVREIKSNIEVAEKKIFDINKKIEELELQLEILKSKRDSYSQQKLLTENCFDEYNNYLVVTDKDVVNGKREVMHGDVIKENPSNYCLVHCTNFLPKEKRKILTNYDGKKVLSEVLTIDGVSKEVEFYSHRLTAHFTINHRVLNTGAGEGNWDDKKYMIIEPLDTHTNQIDNWSINDCYTMGSLKLSDRAIIMVPRKDLDSIPKEILNEYNIVLYNGNPDVCLNNTLFMLGYTLPIETGANDASHSRSELYRLEQNLDCRDKFVNYFSHKKGEPICCFGYDVFDFLYSHLINSDDYIKNEYGKYEFTNSNSLLPDKQLLKLGNELCLPYKFIDFVLSYGLLHSNNGVVSYNEDYILQYMQDIKNGKVDNGLKNNIRDLSASYHNYLYNRHDNEEREVKISEILNLDITKLYDYDYHAEAKCLTSYLKELIPLKDFNLIISFADNKINLYIDVPKNIMINNLQIKFSNVNVEKKGHSGRKIEFGSNFLDLYKFNISIDVNNNVSVRDFIYQYKEIATRVYEEVQRCIDTAKIALDKPSLENALIQKQDNIIKH